LSWLLLWLGSLGAGLALPGLAVSFVFYSIAEAFEVTANTDESIARIECENGGRS
jgi:hypothetical protein